jgi:putative ABC transport system permease protein
MSFGGLLIITIAVAGTYPSLLLSAYKPVSVLYGKLGRTGTINVRKVFTVFQFSIAIIFIICGIVMQRQMHFFRHKDTGINRENIVMVPFGSNVSKHYAAFKGEVRAVPGIRQISIALHPLFKGYDMMGITPPATGKMILMPTLDVDQQLIPMLGLKWKLPPSDSFFYRTKNKIVLNETGVEKLSLGQNPINQKVDQFEVAGVLKDFNWSSLEYKIDGLLLSVTTDDDSAAQWNGKGGCLFAKINPGTNIPTIIDELGRIHSKFDSENPFEYYFMDDVFNDLYKAEERLAKILASFTILAIVIACLGLFGLISFMAVQRTKEIGIRKTLGASVQSIVRLLSGDFLMLVIIAFILASPAAWYFMNQWLQDFAYRIQIDWWIFLLAGTIAVIIALLTISTQAVKAAIANPVKALRSE